MKRAFGFTASWALYILGDFVSFLTDWLPWKGLRVAYNSLMLTSLDLQAWGGSGPWIDTRND